MTAVIAGAVFVAAYALIAVERFDRVAIVLTGAGLLLGLRVVNVHEAFHSEQFGVDWAVLGLLLGMMVIVAILAKTGAFEFAAIRAAKLAKGRPFRILVALALITAGASALLDNVTTVLLVAPVTIVVTRRLGVPPVPYLIAEALASNIGGTATLVGDPPNIIIGRRAGLSYGDFLVHLTPFIVMLLVVFLAACRFMFRRAFVADPGRVADLMALNERAAITDPPLMVRSLGILGLVTAAFVLHGVLGLEPAVIALLGAGVLVLISRRDPIPFLRQVEWHTLAFFAGLFVMVGALVKTGLVDHLAGYIADASGGRPLPASMILIWGSAAISAIVDNIPFVATMTPVVDQLAAGAPAGSDPNVLWWSLALGADLGGNATLIGASANVVIAGTAARHGERITFGQFTRYGLPTAVLSLALATGYVWVRYFALA